MHSLSLSISQLPAPAPPLNSANLTQMNIGDIICNITDADLRKQLMRFDTDKSDNVCLDFQDYEEGDSGGGGGGEGSTMHILRSPQDLSVSNISQENSI